MRRITDISAAIIAASVTQVEDLVETLAFTEAVAGIGEIGELLTFADDENDENCMFSETIFESMAGEVHEFSTESLLFSDFFDFEVLPGNSGTPVPVPVPNPTPTPVPVPVPAPTPTPIPVGQWVDVPVNLVQNWTDIS